MTSKASSASEGDTAPMEMDAWTMATSILTGLHQAEAKARAEYEANLAKGGGNPSAPGVRTAASILESLMDARRAFEPDLRQIARSNRFAMPNVEL